MGKYRLAISFGNPLSKETVMKLIKLGFSVFLKEELTQKIEKLITGDEESSSPNHIQCFYETDNEEEIFKLIDIIRNTSEMKKYRIKFYHDYDH